MSTIGDALTSIMVDMTLGARVKQEREALKLSQGQLGDAVGVTKQAISKIEGGGTQNPELGTFFALAHKFRVNPEWLALGKSERELSESQSARLDFEMLVSAIGTASLQEGALTLERIIEVYETISNQALVIDLPSKNSETSGGEAHANVVRTNEGTSKAVGRKGRKGAPGAP